MWIEKLKEHVERKNKLTKKPKKQMKLKERGNQGTWKVDQTSSNYAQYKKYFKQIFKWSGTKSNIEGQNTYYTQQSILYLSVLNNEIKY